MTEPIHADESLLIDALQGRLSPEARAELDARLEAEPDLRALRDGLANALAGLDLGMEAEPPAGLVDRTLDHIAGIQRTNALLAMQETRGRRWRSTFSLREIGAIAAILLVMVGLLVPSLRLARQRGYDGVCAAQLGQIGSGLQTFAVNHDGQLPTPDGDGDRWMGRDDDTPPVSGSSALFKLLKQRHVARPTVFQCPALDAPSFTYDPSMNDFPKPETISYSYQHTFGPYRLSLSAPALQAHAAMMVILADANPLFEGGSFHPDRLDRPVSLNHQQRGQNVLYLDGHTQWTAGSDVGVEGDNIYRIDGDVQYAGTEAPRTATDTFLLPTWSGR